MRMFAHVWNSSSAMNENPKTERRPSVLSVNVEATSALYAAYMPWLIRGGLFVPSNKPHDLGEPVFLRIQLPDEPEPFVITGTVVWINPPNVGGNRVPGVGIHFDDKPEAKTLRALIEQKLGALLASKKTTHTL